LVAALGASEAGMPHNSYLTPEASEAMAMARVVCITLMMFVHVWPGASAILAAPVSLSLAVTYEVLIEDLARGSVPLLSIVSGLLFFRSASGPESATSLILGKVRSLLVPMVCWSSIMLILAGMHSQATGNKAFMSMSLIEWLDNVFGINGPPFNVPLAFLRDIFACCGIALAILRVEHHQRYVGQPC